MRITRVALVLSAFGVCAQAAPSHLPAAQDQSADINVQNLADLQLDAKLQKELEGAMGRRDYASVETILVREAERDPETSVSLLAGPARLRRTELHRRNRPLGESHRDGSKNDARLRHPWPLLRAFGQARGSDQ